MYLFSEFFESPDEGCKYEIKQPLSSKQNVLLKEKKVSKKDKEVFTKDDGDKKNSCLKNVYALIVSNHGKISTQNVKTCKRFRQKRVRTHPGRTHELGHRNWEQLPIRPD